MNITKEFVFNKISQLGVISLFTSFSLALVGTVWAIYLDSFLHNASYVGFLTTLLAIIAFASYIFMVPFIEKHTKSRIFVLSLVLYTISYFLFALISTVYSVIILGLIIAIISTLRVTSFGILLRDKSKDSDVSKNVGLIYTFFNLAWLLGPLIAGFIAERYGIATVFIYAAGIMLLSLILFKSFKIHDNNKSEKIEKNPFKNLTQFLKNKDLLRSYTLGGGIQFWLSLLYVYIPIYIIESGLKDTVVGYFLFAAVIPCIATEYYFGKLAGKIGFKKMFIMGYSILGVFAILCFVLDGIAGQLTILVVASFGLAMLEPTTEAYFFDVVKKKQRDQYYGPYNTTIDTNSVIALFIGAVILLFLPFKFLFLFVGAAMFIFALIATRVKNIIENGKNHNQ